MVVDGIVLVSRSEIEDVTPPPLETTTATEDLSALKPADEYESVRFRDVKGFTIGLNCRDVDVLPDAPGDGVSGINGPIDVLFLRCYAM